MLKFILIIVLQAGNTINVPLSTLNAEFDSIETCEQARIRLTNSISKSSYKEIIAQGCFKK